MSKETPIPVVSQHSGPQLPYLISDPYLQHSYCDEWPISICPWKRYGRDLPANGKCSYLRRGVCRVVQSLVLIKHSETAKLLLPSTPRSSHWRALVESITRVLVPSNIPWVCVAGLFTEGGSDVEIAILAKRPTVKLPSETHRLIAPTSPARIVTAVQFHE